jgi:hypothetical protein
MHFLIVMLSAVMLNVVMLNVVMLSIVAPKDLPLGRNPVSGSTELNSCLVRKY